METTKGRLGGLAALIGGVSWIAYYFSDLISGILGQHLIEQAQTETPFTALSFALFLGGIVLFNVADFGLYSRLGGRSRGWGIAGLVFSAVAVALAIAAVIVLASGASIPPGMFAGFGVMTTCVATTLMGIAVFRARILPGSARALPLLVGVLTFPLIVGFGFFEAFLPAYVISEMPFALSGLGWLAISMAMRAQTVGAAAQRTFQPA